MGLVSQVFDEPTLATLQGHLAVGHTRYSTSDGSRWENAQPVFKTRTNAIGGGPANGHNGNLTNTAALVGQVIPQESRPGWPVPPRASSDTDVIAELPAREADLSPEEAIVRTMRRVEGLTESAAPAGTGTARGLCTACFTESCPIPDAAGPDPTPSAATQPSTLPPPNPDPEVTR